MDTSQLKIIKSIKTLTIIYYIFYFLRKEEAMILEPFLKIHITGRNRRYYTELGYDCKLNEDCDIKNEDVNPDSHVEETRLCDDCKEKYLKTHQGHIKTFKIFGKDLCPECGHNSKQSKERRKNTCLERYGEETVARIPEVQEKKKETNLERYGYENPMQNKEIQAKAEATCIEKYGEDFREQFYEKTKETMLERYGYDNPGAVPEIREKVEQTCLERCGYTSYLASPEFRKEIEQINLEKYGYANPLSSPEIRQKCTLTLLANGNNVQTSSQQLKVFDIVKALYPELQVELNYPVLGYSLDVCIVSLKIDIEYDGSYWHQNKEEADALRNQRLIDEGYRVIRFISQRKVPSIEQVRETVNSSDKLTIIEI